MKNLYNEFINKNLKDLFKPAVEYMDKEKTGKYRPAEELIEKGGADTLCGIFNNLMGERDYSHFSGKITDNLFIRRRVIGNNGTCFYRCNASDAETIVRPTTLTRLAFKDFFEPLAQLGIAHLRTGNKEDSFLNLNVEEWDKSLIGYAKKILATNIEISVDDVAEHFPDLTIGDVLSHAGEVFMKYHDAVDLDRNVDYWAKGCFYVELFITEAIIFPFLKENTNLTKSYGGI